MKSISIQAILLGFKRSGAQGFEPSLKQVACSLFVLVAMALAPLPVEGAEVWPTTRFKVFAGNPYIGDVSSIGDSVTLYENESVLGVGDEVKREIERAFTEAALWYKKKGFPSPALEPIISTENGLAYQVYVCNANSLEKTWDWVLDGLGMRNNSLVKSDFSRCGYDARDGSTTAGHYLPLCGNDQTRTKIMVVNSYKSLDANNKVTELGYQTIAHELMHAIIANTPLGRSNSNCKVAGWITEGIPDAISYDIAEELWKNRYRPGTTSGQIIKRYGYRPYLERLPQNEDVPIPLQTPPVPGTATYTTSSFWRYVADAHIDGWGVLVTRKPGAAPGLLDIPMPGSRGWRREVTWLDKGLRGKFNLGLNDIYGLFVNHFAYRVPPLEAFRGRPAEDNLERWVGKLFGNCANVDLKTASSQEITLELKGLASACIWVEPTNAPGAIQITFQAGSDDRTLLEDIRIGRTGTALVVKANPIASTPNADTQYVASWRDMPQDGSKRTLYVVSNIANAPVDSKPRSLTLTVALPDNKNTARGSAPLPRPPVAPPPQQPSYEKHAKRLTQQKSATAKMIADQMNLDKKSLNPNVSSATTIRRRANERGCADPFKYVVCGPHMTIRLDLVPGTYASLGQTTAQGGAAAQMFGGMMAMAQTSTTDSEPVVRALAARLDAIDGSSVRIAMPLIDYGYSGTFSNTSISVDMSGGRTLSAFGPPDDQQRTRLTGVVTIEEYTPFVIRGSFTAPLAEFVPSGQQKPVYTRRQTVSGTFTSVAPWLVDERTKILPDSQQQMTDDIVNTLGLPADMVYSMKQDGTIPGGSAVAPSPSGSSSSGGALGPPECTCECEMRPFADELCELLCEEEFAVCDNP